MSHKLRQPSQERPLRNGLTGSVGERASSNGVFDRRYNCGLNRLLPEQRSRTANRLTTQPQSIRIP
jgi:hypothetical protein